MLIYVHPQHEVFIKYFFQNKRQQVCPKPRFPVSARSWKYLLATPLEIATYFGRKLYKIEGDHNKDLAGLCSFNKLVWFQSESGKSLHEL